MAARELGLSILDEDADDAAVLVATLGEIHRAERDAQREAGLEAERNAHTNPTRR